MPKTSCQALDTGGEQVSPVFLGKLDARAPVEAVLNLLRRQLPLNFFLKNQYKDIFTLKITTPIRSSQSGTAPIRFFGYSPTCPAKFPVDAVAFGGLTVTRDLQLC